MPEITFQPVPLSIGIVCSRTAFWLIDALFDAKSRRLKIRGEHAKDASTGKEFSIEFSDVTRFECRQYDDFEAEFSKTSPSNFDCRNEVHGVTYLIWFYDQGFKVLASNVRVEGL